MERNAFREINTPEAFTNWISRVPSVACGCLEWLRVYVCDNPPRFDDMDRYGWALHNAVKAKLRTDGKDRPDFSWEQYNDQWLR